MIQGVDHQNREPWRAAVQPMWHRDAVSVHLYRRYGSGAEVIQPIELISERIEDTAVVREPSLVLDVEMGRALLDALAAHYGGMSEQRQLIDSLTIERDRVNKLLDTVTTTLRILAPSRTIIRDGS